MDWASVTCEPAAPDSFPTRRDYKPNRRKPVPIADRQIIAWDTEGMSLSGMDKPQHPVIFGCSIAEPLIGYDLGTLQMLEHIMTVDREHPKALHVGYGWRYDANMLVKDLSVPLLIQLWKSNRAVFTAGGWVWRLRWIPGKWITISRHRPGTRATRKYTPKKASGAIHYDTGENQSVTIYDYSSFFGGNAFLKTCADILRDDLSDEDREVIRVGKERRGSNEWSDLPDVLHYWRAEIQLIRRVMERFRDVMVKAGFSLKEWYGPGALANYIIHVQKMRPHLAAAQTSSGLLPSEAHNASKYAFAGGRFEMFRAGRISGPIHVWDINSAYPHALTLIPSLAENAGYWEHVESPTEIERFGVYQIDFTSPDGRVMTYRPMPLFRRDNHGLISFPPMVSGWYMSPEARLAIGRPGVTIREGWVWRQTSEVYPWRFLADMYALRQRMGKEDIRSLPFKLGPNSIYGKLAQTVGWDEKTNSPPRSHALLVAAWITSYCRAMLWAGMMKAPGELIAVETDSIITTADIEMRKGDELGEWSHKTYDEIVYVQNGMYHARIGDDWVIAKSRGLDRTDIGIGTILEWLQSIPVGVDAWPRLEFMTRPRFVGLGAAMQSNRPLKSLHRVWAPQPRRISLGETGKRIHIAQACPHCQRGISPYDDAHPLVINFNPRLFGIQSHPRRLPWEAKHPQAVQELRTIQAAEKDLVA